MTAAPIFFVFDMNPICPSLKIQSILLNFHFWKNLNFCSENWRRLYSLWLIPRVKAKYWMRNCWWYPNTAEIIYLLLCPVKYFDLEHGTAARQWLTYCSLVKLDLIDYSYKCKCKFSLAKSNRAMQFFCQK